MAKRIKSKEQEKSDLVSSAVVLMKQGHNPSYITKQLLETSQNKFTSDEIENIIDEATTIIVDSFFSKTKDIRLLHVKRYNREINRLLKTTELDESLIGLPASRGGVTYKSWLAARNKKIKAFDKAIDTMVQLENVLGLSTVSNVVDVKNEVNINVNDIKTSNYDVTKLTFDEQLELLELFQKATIGKDEPVSVCEAIVEQPVITEDIVAEVAPANIESIEKIFLLVPTDNKSQGKTSMDVLQRLKDKLRMSAAKTIHDIGGNLDEQENGLLKK